MTINDSKIYRQETLDKQRLSLIKHFKEFSKMGFYLAGGTGLSLIFGHRNSIDFDFFCYNSFDTIELFEFVSNILGKEDLIIINTSNNTLNITKNGIQISFMTYPYKLIGKTIKTKYFDIASIEDIGVMKLQAIQGRAVNKDYIDLYFIIQKIGLKNLFKNYKKKLGQNITDSLLLKYLVAFDDIEINPVLMNDNISWSEIKKYLQKTVESFFI